MGNIEIKTVLTEISSEGSATVKIKNRKDLSRDKESGESFWIMCELKVFNIDLPDDSDPNNVDWYKITPGQAPMKLSEDSHGEKFAFNKKKGNFDLIGTMA